MCADREKQSIDWENYDWNNRSKKANSHDRGVMINSHIHLGRNVLSAFDFITSVLAMTFNILGYFFQLKDNDPPQRI